MPCGGEACVVGCVVDWKATRATLLVYSSPCYLYLRYLEPTGLHENGTRWELKLTTWTHHVSSWYAVITESGTKPCGMLITCADMLITFEWVWAVGCFNVGRIVFSSCHNTTTPGARTVPNRRCFEPVRGSPVRNVPKESKIAPKRRTSQT